MPIQPIQSNQHRTNNTSILTEASQRLAVVALFNGVTTELEREVAIPVSIGLLCMPPKYSILIPTGIVALRIGRIWASRQGYIPEAAPSRGSARQPQGRAPAPNQPYAEPSRRGAAPVAAQRPNPLPATTPREHVGGKQSYCLVQ